MKVNDFVLGIMISFYLMGLIVKGVIVFIGY